MTFYHPQGTHDDQLWALALAVYATKENAAETTPTDRSKMTDRSYNFTLNN